MHVMELASNKPPYHLAPKAALIASPFMKRRRSLTFCAYLTPRSESLPLLTTNQIWQSCNCSKIIEKFNLERQGYFGTRLCTRLGPLRFQGAEGRTM